MSDNGKDPEMDPEIKRLIKVHDFLSDKVGESLQISTDTFGEFSEQILWEEVGVTNEDIRKCCEIVMRSVLQDQLDKVDVITSLLEAMGIDNENVDNLKKDVAETSMTIMTSVAFMLGVLKGKELFSVKEAE
jgi:hypothetical protein